MSVPVNTLALLGMGLMGAGIAKTLRAIGAPTRIQVYARREETRRECRELDLADAVFASPAAAVEGAELVVACVPVRSIPALFEEAAPALHPDAVLTDVGSTKEWLAKALRGRNFVGSHPMCGSEQTGMHAATATLYRNALCVVVPGQADATERVCAFWTALGCRVSRMDAALHDRLAARASHVPHLAASALVLAAAAGADPGLAALCGTGFRDTTRVASGSPPMWRDIVETNPVPVAEGLRSLANGLSDMASRIENNDYTGLEALLDAAARQRQTLVHPKENPQ